MKTTIEIKKSQYGIYEVLSFDPVRIGKLVEKSKDFQPSKVTSRNIDTAYGETFAVHEHN